MSYYEILMVSSNASPEVIKAAYRTLSQKFHPDKNGGDEESAEMMAKINQAYEVLSSPEKRRIYDQELAFVASRHTFYSNPNPNPNPNPKPNKSDCSSASSGGSGANGNSKYYYKHHGSVAIQKKGSGFVGNLMRFGFWISILCIWLPLATHKPFNPESAAVVAPAPVLDSIKQSSLNDRTRQKLYDAELSRLEAKYPQINPDSEFYDKLVVAEVIRRLETLSQTSERHVALGVAVEQVMRGHNLYQQSISIPRQSNNSLFIPDPRPVNKPSTSREGCEYKGVMTDDDYRACGLNPPKP